MVMMRPCGRTAAAATPTLALVMTLLSALLPSCRAVHLDVHVPLPQGCLAYHALLANRLLREASRPLTTPRSQNNETDEKGSDEEELPQPSEHVDLFLQHTPHVTLYLADFDLEEDAQLEDEGDDGANSTADIFVERALNVTKVGAFVSTIASLNFTEILEDWENCPLAFAQGRSSSYFDIIGAYVMLPVQDTVCLQILSDALLHSLQPYLRHPISVPSWVESLPEPRRSPAVFRTKMYGSPNVREGFDPHVTVGFDYLLDRTESEGSPTLEWRDETMRQWDDAYRKVSGTCVDRVQGIALGKTGEGGTVLADSRMGYWELFDGKEEKGDVSGGDGPNTATWNGQYAVVD